MSWLLWPFRGFHSVRSQACPVLFAVSVASKGRTHGCVHHWHRHPAQCIPSGHATSTSSLHNLWPDPLPKSWSEGAWVVFPYSTHYLQRRNSTVVGQPARIANSAPALWAFSMSLLSRLWALWSPYPQQKQRRQDSDTGVTQVLAPSLKNSALVLFSPLQISEFPNLGHKRFKRQKTESGPL